MKPRAWIVAACMMLAMAGGQVRASDADDLANLDKCSGWVQCQKFFDTIEHYKSALAKWTAAKFGGAKDGSKYSDGDENARFNDKYYEKPLPDRQADIEICVKNNYGQDREGCERKDLTAKEFRDRHPPKTSTPEENARDAARDRQNVVDEDEKLADKIAFDCGKRANSTFTNLDICRKELTQLNELRKKRDKYYYEYDLKAGHAAAAAHLPRNADGTWNDYYQAADIPAEDNDGPVLRRGTNSAGLLNGAIAQSEQFEKNRPAKEAEQKAAQEKTARDVEQYWKERKNQPQPQPQVTQNVPEPQAEDSSDDDSALDVLGTVLNVTADVLQAQADAEAQQSQPVYSQPSPVPSYNAPTQQAYSASAPQPAKVDATGCVRLVDPKTIGIKSNFSLVIKNSCGYRVNVTWDRYSSDDIAPYGYVLFAGEPGTQLHATRE